jgi:site-specific recombinase XerD
MNTYLKDVAEKAGVNKNITFHMARHTFATVIALSNGIPIEYIQSMLGHTELSTTQGYAKILDSKLSKIMDGIEKPPEQNEPGK